MYYKYILLDLDRNSASSIICLENSKMEETDIKILDDLYKKSLKMGRIIYDMAAETLTTETAGKLESYAEYLLEMNDKLEDILTLSDRYAKECLEKATEIRKTIDINEQYANSDMSDMARTHVKLYDGINWGEAQDIVDKKEQILNDVDTKISQPPVKPQQLNSRAYKNMGSIYNKQLGFEWKAPIINKLNEMPPSIYWYNGDQTNPAGLYTCVTRGFYIQVPFPNVIDATQNFNRTGSIKCKYSNVEECLSFRKNLASRYNSEVRECNFAHEGDQYIKLGTTFRCPHKPRFGSHPHLKDDLDTVLDSDIKTMLMYSLSDVLLSSLWFQKTKKGDDKSNMIMANIDIC